MERLTAASADRYEIQGHSVLASLPMVYLARHRKHYRKVALKVLQPALSAMIGAERILRETKAKAGREPSGFQAQRIGLRDLTTRVCTLLWYSG